MSIDLEKVDLVRERTGVSYKEAQEALEENRGDVLEAIVYLEEKGGSIGAFTKSVENKGEHLLEKLKEILKEGNVNKITIKKDGDVVANIPINAGALGFALAPLLATIGISAAIVTKHTIEITKKNGEVVDLKQASEDTMNKAKSNLRKNQEDSQSNSESNTESQTEESSETNTDSDSDLN